MNFKNLLICNFLIIFCACSGTKPVDFTLIHTDDDFARAKIQIYKNFHKCDDPACTTDFFESLHTLLHKLAEQDSSKTLNSLVEIDLLSCLLGSELAEEKFFLHLLQSDQQRDSILELRQGKTEIGQGSIYEEKVLSEKINPELAFNNIMLSNLSREDKDFLSLYTKILLIKYRFNYRLNLQESGEPSRGDKWLIGARAAFFEKYPETKYYLFLTKLSTIQGR
ncbi:MAG TPA: hypothetical protein GXZ47_09820 [Treponema sp.]|jgi:hypothetical protein|nr:hypothetical protein [Treponema sp.]